MGNAQGAVKTVKGLMNSAEKILLCLDVNSNHDTHVAAFALELHMRAQGKNGSFCVNRDLESKYIDIASSFGIKYSNEIKPLSYVITLDHSGGEIEKVSYDDKNGKFNLYISPSPGTKEFDFDNVSFSEGGGDYDLIVVFGAKSLDDLGALYSDNKEIFEGTTLVHITVGSTSKSFGKEHIEADGVSVSEIVQQLIGGASTTMAADVSDLLLEGVISFLRPFQAGDYKISTVETICSLSKSGADFKGTLQKLYTNMDLEHFTVFRRLLGNVKYDVDAGIIWSVMSSYDLDQCGIADPAAIDFNKIPFNVVRDLNIAFVIYETDENSTIVDLESSGPVDAMDLLSDFSPQGDSVKVRCVVEDKAIADLEVEILDLLKDKMELSSISADVDGSVDISQPSKEEPLTDSDSDGNNGAARADENESGTKRSGLVTPPPIVPENSSM